MKGALFGEDAGAEARRRAVAELRASTEPDVAARLMEALGDVDWRVRKEAIGVGEAVARHVSLVPLLVDAISQSDNVGLRNAALELIGRLGQTALEVIVESLGTVPVAARKFVIAALGEAGRTEDVPVLERAMDDADPNVVAAALDAISRIGGPEAERVLRARLQSSDSYNRIAALDGLDRLRAKVPYEELLSLASDRLVRKVALQVMGRSGDARAVAPIVEALADPLPHVVAACAVALSRLHDEGGETARLVAEAARGLSPDVREQLRFILEQGEPTARQAAARVLILARETSALAGVVALAAADSFSVKELLALREWGAGVLPELFRTHDSAAGKSRAVSLELLSYLAHGSGASPAPTAEAGEVRRRIRDDLRSDDADVRLYAARCMLQWAEGEDATLLTDATRRGPAEVSRASAHALDALAERNQSAVRMSLAPVRLDGPGGAALTSVVARLSEDNVLTRMQSALTADDPDTRRAAVEALGLIGGAEAAELVGMALTDEHRDVQASAARVLGGLRDKQGRPVGVDRLLLAISSEESTVRAAAARALGRTGDGRARDALCTLASSPDGDIASSAIEGLRALADPTTVQVFVKSLDHDDEEVVKQALWAISEVAGNGVAPRLASALQHHSWDVRQLAAMLLGEAGGEAALQALRQRFAVEDYDLVRDAIASAITILESAE